MKNFSFRGSYISLSKICEPEVFGEIIGAGFNSLAIKTEFSTIQGCKKLKNPILLISKELEKFSFLKKLFPKKVEKIYLNRFIKKEALLFKEIKNSGFSFFYMEEMSLISMSDEIEKTLFYITDQFEGQKYHKDDLFSLVEDIKKEFSNDIEEQIILNSILEAFKALEETDIDNLFYIDLHPSQFLSDGESIYCVDPFLFNG